MLSDAPLRAILLDVGGPIIDERPDYINGQEIVRNLLREKLNREITDAEINNAREQAIMSWSPSFTKAIIWHFLKPDRERTSILYNEAIRRIFTHREDVTLVDGIEEIIPKLGESYKLALAGNQPIYMKDKLDRTGLMKYFTSTILSADLELHKPDSRFFLEICRRIEEPPENCCMIGDRLDCDIYPANVLGMRTIWVRVGPHAVQQPRIPEDVPDATVECISEIPDILADFQRGE